MPKYNITTIEPLIVGSDKRANKFAYLDYLCIAVVVSDSQLATQRETSATAMGATIAIRVTVTVTVTCASR